MPAIVPPHIIDPPAIIRAATHSPARHVTARPATTTTSPQQPASTGEIPNTVTPPTPPPPPPPPSPNY